MDSEYLLELKQITKYFPGVHALNGVSFGIRAGEVRRSWERTAPENPR